MTDYTNGHEKRARTRKVRRICRWFRSVPYGPGATRQSIARSAGRLSDQDWTTVAEAAGTTVPSIATRRRVVAALHVYEEDR